MIDIVKEVENARYSATLQLLLNELGAKELLRKNYQSSSQGHVDVDVLLNDGRVFSYHYAYGSCPDCDEWDHKKYSGGEIKTIMMQEATFFDDIEQYRDWRRICDELGIFNEEQFDIGEMENIICGVDNKN